MNSDLSEESSQEHKRTNREFLDEGRPLPMTASKCLPFLCSETPLSYPAGGDSSGLARHGNGKTEKSDSKVQKMRKASQNQTKLSKSIQNNIDMYFKRDFTKLRTVKEAPPTNKKSQVEKKTVQTGSTLIEKGTNKQPTNAILVDPQSGSINPKLRNKESPSKTNRVTSNTDSIIER